MAATDPERRHPASFATARRASLRAGPTAALLLVFAAALQAAQPVRTTDFDQMVRDQAVTDRRWREACVGFMRIETPPGEHDIRLVYELPLESVAGRVLTLAALAAALALVTKGLLAAAPARS